MSSNLRPLASAILKSGILPETSLKEFSKWGFPFEPPEGGGVFASAEDLLLSLENALQSEGLVVERVTDLDTIKQYMLTATPGKLHVEINGETAEFSVVYGTNLMGEFIIPWKGDNVFDEMTNGLTHLITKDNEKVYFNVVRDFYFGETKAFMICAHWK